MTQQFVIKIGDWYYNKYPDITLVPESYYATKFAHPDVAKQEITEKKLKDAKVMQINLVENEIK